MVEMTPHALQQVADTILYRVMQINRMYNPPKLKDSEKIQNSYNGN